jgi:hypothetical protein
MVTYEQLWAADPAAWRAAGSAWCALIEVIERRTAEVSGAAETLRSDWAGVAGRAADGRLVHLQAELAASRPVFIEIDQVLAEHAARLVRAKAMLDAAVTAAERAGVLVDRDGRVSLDPAASRSRGSAQRAVAEVAAGIRAALELAASADRDAARRLGDLAAAAGSSWVAAPPGWPPTGADPVAVRQWWDGLTPAQRRWLVGHEPALVGRLDGVPAAARDQANRLLLGAQRADLLARRTHLLCRWPRTPGVVLELARVGATLAGLDAVAVRLARDTGPRAYLLGLDPAGDGRAIVAFGDPDQADNVLTYVPGMTSDLPGVGGALGRAERMAARCAELEPTEATAAVLWLDYDAPDFFDEAMRASHAHDAGPALHRFQEGLRATHDGAPAHQTVLGHSYGSVVVGSAARDYGLAADSLVFLGSPGVGVDHAADLHVPAGQIWSSTARDDVIQYGARAPGEVLTRLAVGVALPVLGVPLAFGRPGDELWFGHNPSDPGFGGQVFQGAARGHEGYWDAGNPALDGMARIALGDRP